MHEAVLTPDRGLSEHLWQHDVAVETVVFPTRYLRFGVFELDVQRQRLSADGTSIAIRGKLYEALIKLLEHPGEVVSRKALRDQLWPGNDKIDVATNLNSTINKLRRLLCDVSGEHPLIETIVHKGYAFTAKVEYADCAISEDPGRQPGREEKSRPHWPAIPRAPHAELQTVYFKASLIVLTIASVLFGAAVALYAFRPISYP